MCSGAGPKGDSFFYHEGKQSARCVPFEGSIITRVRANVNLRWYSVRRYLYI
jgi:hypothetical protein